MRHELQITAYYLKYSVLGCVSLDQPRTGKLLATAYYAQYIIISGLRTVTCMKKNVGTTDGTVRILLGAVAGLLSLGILASAVPLPPIASPIFGVVSIMMIGTSLTGFCPAYTLLGVDTCPVSPQ